MEAEQIHMVGQKNVLPQAMKAAVSDPLTDPFWGGHSINYTIYIYIYVQYMYVVVCTTRSPLHSGNAPVALHLLKILPTPRTSPGYPAACTSS